MGFRRYTNNDLQIIVRLFESVFTDSEGKEEGQLIGRLAKDLFDKTDKRDLFNFVAVDDGQVVGSIFFSRLDFGNSVEAFILGPVAVHSANQGEGIGQGLINYGLGELKDNAVSIVLTYGDPGFYCRLGFQAISHEDVIPPFKLTQSEGWLGLSLGDDSLESLQGAFVCVEALSDPVYW